MKNSVFILSFDRDSISDIRSLHNGVTKNALVKNWFHYIKSSYIIVATTNNADILSKSLDAALNGIRYILLEVNISNCNGYLPQKAWDWIERIINKSEGGLTFDSLLGASLFRLAIIIKKSTSFKIGKTGLSPEERRNKPDYKDVYPNITSLFSNKNRDLVSLAESEIINNVINDPKCDNKKDGRKSLNDNMSESDNYCVYVVWR